MEVHLGGPVSFNSTARRCVAGHSERVQEFPAAFPGRDDAARIRNLMYANESAVTAAATTDIRKDKTLPTVVSIPRICASSSRDQD